MDYGPIYTIVRTILGDSEDTLPDTDPRLTLIIRAIVRRFWVIDPEIATAWSSDPATSAVQTDKDAFHEFIAWAAASRLYNMPRAEGDEIIQKLKIGQLELTYLRQGISELSLLFQQESLAALRTISFVVARREAAKLAGTGKPRFHIANPSRVQSGLTPREPAPVTVLFTMPITDED